MKKTGVLLAVLFASLIAGAQVKEGTIFYESQTDIRSKIPESMRAMIPAVIKMNAQLIFRDSIAVYLDVTKGDDDNPGVMMTGTPGILFTDLISGVCTEQVELSGTTYRIIDSVQQLHWKLVPDSVKTIAGFVCKKATVTAKDGTLVQAWYTEQIPLPVGPRQYGNLPGAILLLNNGENVITATKFVTSIGKSQLQKPVKGKLISRKAYTEKMQSEFGSGMHTMIIGN